jgi:hypothetical protein
MHTYCNGEGGWQAGYQHSNGGAFRPLGPTFDFEWEAAAYASFLTGGRFSPGEIELLFGVDRSPEEDDDSTYPRPQGMDYEPEPKRAHK